ncbi:seipin [Leptopilina heterotoma]|uniref:seipin n=1 Tax=Leptopilina heterotoma TaxID=63436 RepID=UPI001CA7E4C4|nr:seipin [Leptopilina heterotoma]
MKINKTIMIPTRIIKNIINKLLNVHKKTTQSVQTARDAAVRGGLIIISAVLIVWISIFLYTAFYYAYMPSMSYVRPVHLQFRPCDHAKGVCSFPSAHIQLTKKQQFLMVGQPYKVNLHLEMPESPANKELGMFMVCAELKSQYNRLVDHSCRSAMLHYRSTLLHFISTLTFSPMMIFGTTEETQNIVLELFGNFEEDQSQPVTRLYVEIQSRHIEFYSATLTINAHLSGLRYLMFHWPILSAMVGISTNLFFIALVCILSYLHFVAEEDTAEDDFEYEKGDFEEERDLKSNNDRSSETSSLEDASLLEDITKPHEGHSSHLMDPVLDKPSYIQEISKLIDETAGDLSSK